MEYTHTIFIGVVELNVSAGTEHGVVSLADGRVVQYRIDRSVVVEELVPYSLGNTQAWGGVLQIVSSHCIRRRVSLYLYAVLLVVGISDRTCHTRRRECRQRAAGGQAADHRPSPPRSVRTCADALPSRFLSGLPAIHFVQRTVAHGSPLVAREMHIAPLEFGVLSDLLINDAVNADSRRRPLRPARPDRVPPPGPRPDAPPGR